MIFTKLLENYTGPTQYLSLTMSTSTNTHSSTTENTFINTEANTIPTPPSPYLDQTDFATTIEKLPASFTDNNVKHDEKPKERITEQDTKFDKQIHTFPLHIQ